MSFVREQARFMPVNDAVADPIGAYDKFLFADYLDVAVVPIFAAFRSDFYSGSCWSPPTGFVPRATVAKQCNRRVNI